jgi:hypothetical protein
MAPIAPIASIERIGHSVPGIRPTQETKFPHRQDGAMDQMKYRIFCPIIILSNNDLAQ